MKPEPLKGKVGDLNLKSADIISGQLKDFTFKSTEAFVNMKDIRSAVEWLKQKVSKGTMNLGKQYDLDMEETLEAIDQAFEDVMK